jgi:hypothetical protein
LRASRRRHRGDTDTEEGARDVLFTTFDVPGAGTGLLGGGTFPSSINPAGEITGSYTDEYFVSHGFLRIPHESK